VARKQSEIANATRRATWLVYSNRALRNVIFMPAYDAVDHWLRRRLVAYLYRTLIPVRQSEFMLQLKIKKAATDRSQHAWSGSSPRRYAWTLCTATCLFTLAKPGLQQHRPRHGTRPLNLGDSLDRRSDDAVVGVLRPLGNGRTRTVRIGADSGPVDPGAAGPAGAAEDHTSVRVEPARRSGTAPPRWVRHRGSSGGVDRIHRPTMVPRRPRPAHAVAVPAGMDRACREALQRPAVSVTVPTKVRRHTPGNRHNAQHAVTSLTTPPISVIIHDEVPHPDP